MIASVDKFGRIVIPKKLRDRLGIRAGSSLEVSEHEGHIELAQVVQDTGWSIAEDGLPVFSGEWPANWPADFDMVAWHREKRMRRIMGLEEA